MQYTSVLDQLTRGGSATGWSFPSSSIDLTAVDDQPLPCQDTTTQDLWFAERTDEIERAKALCTECPLRAECLAGALERREPWGVWGGEVFVDGQVVARKRGRGRPRKNDPYAPAASRSSSAA
ncbi:WhiB family transcriptional regulator [Ruania alba]|uniref:Transcriptional regulator WhiB n=1 Tax=Ruania alba TaxID=648782 RepID=A0A1H5CVV5_9MICO|nr:WhiB family transcriptional regulator [Ruania alba]SED70806.1 WhiB family transcriptional regulator, redox-sensing transcriptional regulator [Ruania alba]